MSSMMRVGRALSPARLRTAFLTFGVLLVAGLVFLSYAMERRLKEARRDREEMVAARVFDEMEREISAFLEGEGERPHYLDFDDTNPEAWAPFVVGYFAGAHPQRLDATRIVAAEGKVSEHRRRVYWALREAQGSFADDQSREVPTSQAPGQATQERAIEPAPVAPIIQPAPASPKKKEEAPRSLQQKSTNEAQIIQQLNRAPERRKSKAVQQQDAEADPFSDYSESF
jgi:hypothetical protein